MKTAYTFCLSAPFLRQFGLDQSTPSVDVILEMFFWDSIQRGSHRRMEGECILAVIVLWRMLFRGRVAPSDELALDVEGLMLPGS